MGVFSAPSSPPPPPPLPPAAPPPTIASSSVQQTGAAAKARAAGAAGSGFNGTDLTNGSAGPTLAAGNPVSTAKAQLLGATS